MVGQVLVDDDQRAYIERQQDFNFSVLLRLSMTNGKGLNDTRKPSSLQSIFTTMEGQVKRALL